MAIDLQARRQLEARLDQGGAWVSRHRHAVGPMLVALGVTGIAAGAWSLAVGRGWGWTQWAVTAVAVFVWILHFSAVHELPNPREKQYARAAFTAACAYAAAVVWWGPVLWLLVVGGVVTVCLGIPWYVHRRVRISVSVEKEIAAWGDGSAVGLPGVELVQAAAKAGADWWSAPMRARERGQWTRSQMRQAKERIAARYGVSAEQVHITDRDSEGEALLTVHTSRAVKTLEPLPLPTERRPIEGPHEVCRYLSDNSPGHITLYEPGYGAIDGAGIGVKGSGKSSEAELVAEIVISSTNALLFAVDLKPGAQHWKGWENATDMFARTPAELDVMLQVFEVICEYRGVRTEGTIHVPTPTAPQIVLLIDEAALAFSDKDALTDFDEAMDRRQVIANRVALMEKNTRVSRSFGECKYMFTQDGYVDSFGNGFIFSELKAGNLAIFRTADRGDTGQILSGIDVDPSRFPKNQPGTAYWSSYSSDRDEVVRFHKRTDKQIGELVSRFPAGVPGAPSLEPGLLDAIRARVGDAYDRRFEGRSPVPGRSAVPASPTGVPAVVPSGVPAVSPEGGLPDFAAANAAAGVPEGPDRLSPEESRARVLEALRELGPDATTKAIAERVGRSVTLTRARLNELAAEGLATSKGKREPRWTATQ
ncbi:winged helix-turn-helix transcriptional regulator [Kutzneria albida]|uniref:Uncharacterized protein n=1 Tax=Kutzneria albida DSM 43870 TaxID=1449976 RepID=W5WCL5_9PSEU|nr:winged helix-turn-helix domain-containing protein [Kutzneria albida]AHH98286.1 hypothetical protein KALB_4924 [Kutzneria albida DSM 43870]